MTPVHDQSYRRYRGPRRPVGRAWLVIMRAGIAAMLSRRILLALMVLAWLPFVIRSVQLYAVVAYPRAGEVLPVDARMFQSFVETQGFFAFFITIIVGAGLIADDRRANALQVYLSKPLLRIEYVAGKLGVLLVYVGAATLLPGLLLLTMQAVFAGNLQFLREHAFLVPAVTLASLLRMLVASLTMLALSALSTSARYVAVMYAGVVFFTEAAYGVLSAATGSTSLAWVSVTNNFEVIGDAVFRQPPRYDTPVAVSAIVLAGLVALSLSVLERRVRGVEVVS